MTEKAKIKIFLGRVIGLCEDCFPEARLEDPHELVVRRVRDQKNGADRDIFTAMEIWHFPAEYAPDLWVASRDEAKPFLVHHNNFRRSDLHQHNQFLLFIDGEGSLLTSFAKISVSDLVNLAPVEILNMPLLSRYKKINEIEE